MVTIQVRDGTPDGGQSLCVTCEWGHVRQGFRSSEELTFCRKLYPDARVPFPVSRCNDYTDRNVPSLPSMQQIAWILVSKSAGRPIGFVTPQRYQELESEAARAMTPDETRE